MGQKMIESILSFFTLGQGPVTLYVVGVLTVSLWVAAMCRGRELDSSTLLMFAVNVVGVVTGVYIFAGAFDLMKTSMQNGIYSGITGCLVSIVTLQNLIREIKALCRRQVEPTRKQPEVVHTRDSRSSESTTNAD
jgi:hypothetical protein